MTITKDHIASNPNYSDGAYFDNKDGYYNFKHTFEQARSELHTARLYVRQGSALQSRLQKILDLIHEIHIDD